MSLYIEGNIDFPFDVKEIAEMVVDAALEHIGCPYEAEISLLITHDEEIHEMNREHRGIDRATDVLSFPMLEFDIPGNFSGIAETGELMLGDIVISADKVMAQAEEYGHSPKREYAFLIAHSMLHLCGYDHMEDDERKEMEQKQRMILEKINILR